MREALSFAFLAFIPVSIFSGCQSELPGTQPKNGKACLLGGNLHIPRAVQSFSDQGTIAEDRELEVTVALELNNEAELDQRIAEMYDPGSARFHQFLATGEFRARYSPTEEQIGKVKAFFKSHGIKTVSLNANGYLIRMRGKAAELGNALHARIHEYRSPDGKTYFSPSSELVLPRGLPVQAVHGLQNITRARSYAHSSETPFGNGNGPNGGLSPADIRAAYDIPSDKTGKGQVLALMELDGYDPADIATYEKTFGLPSVPLKNILVDGATGAAGSGAIEVTLDLELMIAVAPGASQILVYEAPNDMQSILDLYAKIANDNLARQISTSWGAPELESSQAFLQTENTIFKQMAAQGQSFYAAAGDSGAYDNRTNLSVDDPASQPFVVSVGGTHLNFDGRSYSSETSWNGGSASAGAGGGGISMVWAQPSWQNGISNSGNLASSRMRNVPDVSLDADPASGYAVFSGGNWTTVGGTSCAAPLWAAFTALVNHERQGNGLAPLGFANPFLYALGSGSTFANDFHDILDGSTNLYFPAVTGYDDATGWGSFNGQNLLMDLIKEPPINQGLKSGSPGC